MRLIGCDQTRWPAAPARQRLAEAAMRRLASSRRSAISICCGVAWYSRRKLRRNGKAPGLRRRPARRSVGGSSRRARIAPSPGGSVPKGLAARPRRVHTGAGAQPARRTGCRRPVARRPDWPRACQKPIHQRPARRCARGSRGQPRRSARPHCRRARAADPRQIDHPKDPACPGARPVRRSSGCIATSVSTGARCLGAAQRKRSTPGQITPEAVGVARAAQAQVDDGGAVGAPSRRRGAPGAGTRARSRRVEAPGTPSVHVAPGRSGLTQSMK